MNGLKNIVKQASWAAAALLVLPLAVACLFGKLYSPYLFFAQTLALVPGTPGSFLRVAFYGFTLSSCARDCHIAFGTYFSQPRASVASGVGIGAYCVLGRAMLGEGALIGSGVQILSGARQHVRDAQGLLTDEGRVFEEITVGPNCWIGASALVMASLGAQVTVAAGSVVSREVPAGSVVAGNPARAVRPPSAEAVGQSSLAS